MGVRGYVYALWETADPIFANGMVLETVGRSEEGGTQRGASQ